MDEERTTLADDEILGGATPEGPATDADDDDQDADGSDTDSDDADAESDSDGSDS